MDGQRRTKLMGKRFKIGIICLGFLIFFTQAWAVEKQRRSNLLIHEKSPYLLQHADNPIWWYPWGKEAFEAARRENKPIFLSIGYSTCHWCHVMEGDSFENEEVAALMNKHFIAVKVDREERPDVDQIYLDILMGMNGNGGWPISLFLTQELVPFTGATFIPRKQFIIMLRQISQVWQQDRQRIENMGKQVSLWLSKQADQGFLDTPIPEDDIFQKFLNLSQQSFDPLYGGFNQGPKFPQSIRLSLLMRIYKRTGDEKVLELVTKTLDGMARGAIYDQLGGGFHRYSTDSYWQIPHFEKMLYTNATLAVNYLEAFQITNNQEYAQIAKGILDYILRDMTHPLGGFYSAEDADSEKTEGKFYVWTEEELKKVLTPKEMEAIVSAYHVTAQGNFNPDQQVKEFEASAGLKAVEHANAFYISLNQALPNGSVPVLRQAQNKLMKIRADRIRPSLDDKILTAWNGLTIHAMATAYQVLRETKYLDAARKSAHFLLNRLKTKEGRLKRRWREGTAQINAYLNDYAFLIQGILTLYQSDFDPFWYKTALQLQKQQDFLFWDSKADGYFFSDVSDTTLLQRKKTFHDQTLPSGNAVSSLNLLKLSDLSLNLAFKEQAAKIISASGLKLVNFPIDHSQMLIALEYLLDRSKEVAVVGPADHPLTQKVIKYMHSRFLPNKVVAMGPPIENENQIVSTLPLLFNKPMLKNLPTTYVCESNICQLPTGKLSKIQEFVNYHKKYSWLTKHDKSRL